jgi:plastocyanin
MTARSGALRLVALAVLLASLLVACAEDVTTPSPPSVPGPGEAPAADTMVVTTRLEENRYDPEELSAPANSEVTIRFENGSGVEHTLTFEGEIEGDTGVVAPGAVGEITIQTPEPGRYRFFCQIHPTMEGELVVL